jgi:hypothetical protein
VATPRPKTTGEKRKRVGRRYWKSSQKRGCSEPTHVGCYFFNEPLGIPSLADPAGAFYGPAGVTCVSQRNSLAALKLTPASGEHRLPVGAKMPRFEQSFARVFAAGL